MGRLKSVAINETASPCTDEGGQPIQMPCCEDVRQELKVEDVTQASFDFDVHPDLFELAIIHHILLQDIGITPAQERPSLLYYDPPLPDRDIPILTQSFLI